MFQRVISGGGALSNIKTGFFLPSHISYTEINLGFVPDIIYIALNNTDSGITQLINRTWDNTKHKLYQGLKDRVEDITQQYYCLLYTSPSPRDRG